jgi:sugar lactone lactonase YvrE
MTHSLNRKRKTYCTEALGAALIAAALTGAADAGATFAKGRVFAPVPKTTAYPEGIAVGKRHVFVAGPSKASAAGTLPSRLLVLHKKSGKVARSLTIEGEDLSSEHALHGIAVDKHDRVYVLSTQLGVLRFWEHKKQWLQSTYAGPFPDMPPCGIALPGEDCSPTELPLPPEPTDMAFLQDGTAFVTDARQATIYRIPPGGGAPEIWFQSAKLAGFYDLAGVSAVRASPDGTSLFVTVSYSAEAPWEGRIYSIPLVDQPNEADLELVHTFDSFEAPDGLAIGEDGDLWVALSVTNEIAIVSPDGGELDRISGPTGSSIGFDGPAGMAFNGHGDLFVTNSACGSDIAAHFAVLEVDAKDKGTKPFMPK